MSDIRNGLFLNKMRERKGVAGAQKRLGQILN